MDASAIGRIEQLAAANALNALVQEVDVPVAFMPQGSTAVNLEKYNAFPRRHRATVTTQRVDDFICYANDHNADGSALFIDPANLNALMVFDYAKQWGEHKLKLNLKMTPEYERVKSHPVMPQDAMRDWMVDFQDVLTAHDAEDGDRVIDFKSAFQAISKVTITATSATTTEKSDFKATRSGLEQIEAQGTNAFLPDYFILNAPLYEGMEPRQIKLKLAVKWNDNQQPLFALRIVAHDFLLKAVAKELESMLSVIDTKIYVGNVSINQPS